jgi:hypothetical protein
MLLVHRYRAFAKRDMCQPGDGEDCDVNVMFRSIFLGIKFQGAYVTVHNQKALNSVIQGTDPSPNSIPFGSQISARHSGQLPLVESHLPMQS